MHASPMADQPLDLDKHRGLAAQKATDLRRVMMEVESHARELRERQVALETQILSAPAASWTEASAKARYVLNLYATSLSPNDTLHLALVAAVFADFDRLTGD